MTLLHPGFGSVADTSIHNNKDLQSQLKIGCNFKTWSTKSI